MLGFSSISELALAQLPHTFIHTSGLSASAVVDSANPEVNADANVLESELGSVSATMTLGELASVTGTANISIEGITTTLSLGSVLVWGNIIPAPGTSYTTITPSSSPTWTSITTGSTPTWTNIDL